MELSDAKGMKAADKAAIEGGIGSLLLMETAAGKIVAAVKAALDRTGRGSAAVFCGPGNNGGDGVAAARMLREAGVRTRVWLVGDRGKMTADTRAMEEKLIAAGGVLEAFEPDSREILSWTAHAAVIVDAIFGVGLSRPLTGDALAAVRLINRVADVRRAAGVYGPVIAADIASGVSADTGCILGDAVRADGTVTFSRAKPGHFIEPGCTCCGELRVEDIGLPPALAAESGCGVYAVHGEDLRLLPRPKLSHKGDYGKLLVLGGSVPYTGAPSLCAKAAVRSGAGLVYLGVPADIYEITAVKNDEAMAFPRTEGSVADRLAHCGACVIGPGMGRSEDTLSLVSKVLRDFRGHVVADADALWAIAQDPGLLDRPAVTPAATPYERAVACLEGRRPDPCGLDRADACAVLTPHEGEFARLLGRAVEDRLADALGYAREHRCVVVLKGYRTICAFPDGKAYVIDAGNPGMASGGSGDVLAGVIGAMLGQLPFRRAVVTACWLHARAGDIAATRYGEYAMKAGDIIESLPRAEMEILG